MRITISDDTVVLAADFALGFFLGLSYILCAINHGSQYSVNFYREHILSSLFSILNLQVPCYLSILGQFKNLRNN